MNGKRRLDVFLCEEGLCASRTAAQALIMSGKVNADGQMRDKASYMVADEGSVFVTASDCGFVSRGGLKLKKAFEVFPLFASGKVAVDVGASTGGFTDCLLQRGAAHVFSVDVGYGIIALKLRNDPRVTVMERTNARYLTPEMFPERPALAVMDASFISLKLLLPPLVDILTEEGQVVALIKPQFEAGRGKVGKNGVVRDRQVHDEVISGILGFARGLGFSVLGLDYSPVTGPKGNIEYLLFLGKTGEDCGIDHREVVSAAFLDLRR